MPDHVPRVYPLLIPLTDPVPLPMPLVWRRVVEEPLAVPRTPSPPTPPELEPGAELVALPRGCPLPLPLDARLGTLAAASARRLSSSSAFRATAALRSCSSYSLLSAACCLIRVSCSASMRS